MSSPGALAELFETYGDRLFRYCWCMLRNREIAQVALRDTLVVAQAHSARLADPEYLGPWLYSLARAECRRRRAVPPADADEPPARPSQRDADSRLMAWNAVMSMEADEFEALELACRHDVDLGLVLGLPAEDAQALLDRARQSLERALGAEILVSRGYACPDRAEVMSGWAGVMTAQMRERVLEHAGGCEVCGPNRPRNVSAARVFALLPAPALSPLARAEVLDFFADHRLSPYREFAVSRTSVLAESGFPVRSEPPAAARVQDPPRAARRPRRVPRAGVLLAGAGAIASAAVIASAFVLAGSAGKPAAVREIIPTMAAGWRTGPAPQGPSDLGNAGAVPPSGPSGTESAPSSRPRLGTRPRLSTPPPLASTAAGQGQVMITAATQPLPPAKPPVTQKSAPAQPATTGAGGTMASPGTLQVSTDRLAVGTGSTGQITLTAVGGTVNWSASSSSPVQVSLSSYFGKLQAGQSVTLTVTVTRGANRGSATISLEPPASAPQTVQVSWMALPKGPERPGHLWPPRPSPPAPAPSPTSASPSPTVSASPSPSSPSPSPSPSSSSLSGARLAAGGPRPRRVAGPQTLSWNGDRRAPFAYRAGQARTPDQPRTGPALSRRAHRTELQNPA
jgi:DNA-directed RNA polymerase specialized sigma24 family protein